jgi:hypothetical protein
MNKKIEVNHGLASKLVNLLNEANFYGGKDSDKFGFLDCNTYQNYIYGFFVQHYLEDIDYYNEDKELIEKNEINSERFAFYINFSDNHILLQSRQNSDLPTRTEIVKRFVEGFNFTSNDLGNGIRINKIDKATIGEDREKIINTFYNTKGRVTKVSAKDFKKDLFNEDFTWFNPRDEFRDAMQQTGEFFIEHTDQLNAKAKKSGNLQKVPQVRYAVETSNEPKITVIDDGKESVLATREDVRLQINISENLNTSEEMFIELINIVKEKTAGYELKPKNNNVKKDNNGQLPLF